MAIMLSAPTVVKKSTVNRAFMTGKLASAAASASGDVSFETSLAVSRFASLAVFDAPRSAAPMDLRVGSRSRSRILETSADIMRARRLATASSTRSCVARTHSATYPRMTDPKHAPTRMKTMT